MSSIEEALRQAQVAFQGRIVASATHEFQNHLAVIKEYGGLVGDLLPGVRKEPRKISNRCIEITGKIHDRANLAAEMVDVLNRFAHRADQAVCSFRVNEAVEEVAVLSRRLAAAGKISLTASSSEEAAITNNPALLQYLLFSVMAPFLDGTSEGGSILITSGPGREDGALIEIIADRINPAPAGPDQITPELLDACLEKMTASLTRQAPSDTRMEIVISVPSLAQA
jgi:C4-dicarboxylate-specific signal transduction histidine kinase